jgi:hypothetical protein
MQNVIRNMTAAVIAITILVVPFLVVRMGFEVAFIGTSQEIEQLRNDMVGISRGGLTHGGNIGVALGQATSWNQTIRRMQAYNYRWWGDPFIPDGWNNISTIPIPRT